MASASDYKIILKGSIDPKSIETELKNIENKYKLILNVQLNSQQLNQLQTKIGSIQKQVSSIGAANPLEPMATTAVDVEKRVQQIRDSIDRFAKVNVSGFVDEDGVENLNRAVITYTDGLGRSVTETMQLKEETIQTGNAFQKISGWQTTSIRYADNIAKKEKDINAEVIKRGREYEKMTLQADKFLEKSKALNQANPVVFRGINLANQLKQSIEADRITGQLSDKTKRLSDELTRVNERVRTSGKNLQSWSTEIGIAIKRTIEWATGIGLIYGALNQLKQGTQYVKDLNKEMVNIQVLQADGARTNEEINRLSESFNGLAREMSVTTLEVARGSVEWLRQGKTIAETEELLKATMMLSKLGAIDSAQATEYLTSTLNGYQLEASEAVNIVSKLVAVDNIAATSSAELAEAMRKTANFANESGVSMNKLIGWIATVSSVSRKSADTIGTSFQAMFSRLQNIKLNRLDSEDGTTLNDVEQTLARVGISLRDSETSFRDMSAVIDDLAKKWDTLNDIEKMSITQAIAGTRQRENLIILLDNYADSLRYTEVATDSAGTALKRYAIYQESIEASSNRLTTAWERMWSKFVSSDALKGLYDMGTGALDLIDKLGGLETFIQAVVTALILLNIELIRNNIILFAGNIGKAVAGLILFKENIQLTAMALRTGMGLTGALSVGFGTMAVATGAILAALVALVAVWKQWNTQIVETQNLGLEGTAKAWATQLESVGTSSKTAADQLNAYKEAVERVNEAHAKAGILATLFVDKQEIIKQGLIGTIELLGESSSSYQEYIALVKEAAKVAGYGVDDEGRLFKDNFSTFGNIRTYIDDIQLLSHEQFNLAEASEMAADTWVEKWKRAGSQVRDSFTNIITTLEQLQSMVSAVNDISFKQIEGDFLFEDMAKLAEVYPNYLNALSIENGQVKVNTDVLREYNIEKANATLKSMEAAKATAVEKGYSQDYIDTLNKQIELFENYIYQLERAVPLSSNYVDTFDAFIKSMTFSMSGEDISRGFGKLAETILEINDQFRDGAITAEEYLDSINDNLDKIDMRQMFADNQLAAQTFFSGMTMNAMNALSQINSSFESGDMLVTDYVDSLDEVAEGYVNIGDTLLNYYDTLGLTEEQAGAMKDSVTDAMGDIQTSTEGLIALQELNGMVQQTMAAQAAETLQFGTEAYNLVMQDIANAAMESGIKFEDADGKVFESSQGIYEYLTANAANFGMFADQTARNTGELVQNLFTGIGELMKQVGEAINNFHAEINIAPKMEESGLKIALPGMEPISLPKVKYEITASGGESFSQIGQAALNFANVMSSLKPITWDSSIYTLPDKMNQVTGKTGGAAGAFNDLAKAIGGAGAAGKKEAEEMSVSITKLMNLVITQIKEQKKEEKELLRAQLAGYKEVIDARKKILDQMLEEKERKGELSEKQKGINQIQAELLELQFDDSREALAKRLELQEQLVEAQKELADYQFKQGIEDQKDALDEDYENYKKIIDEKIAVIDAYLERSGQIAIDALTMIRNDGGTLYDQLIEWNRQYGSGIDEDVIQPWEEAYDIIRRFKGDLSEIATKYKINVETGEITPEHHSGVYAGPVGGNYALKSNEQFVKMLRGEVAITPQQMDRYMSYTLPSLLGVPQNENGSNNNVVIEKFLEMNVEGNVDESTLPKIESIVNKAIDKLNTVMHNRGYLRSAHTFS